MDFTADPTLAAAALALQPLLEQLDDAVLTAAAIFVRISAIVFMLPGFGERVIPVRIKLMGALAFAAFAWAPVMADAPRLTADASSFGVAFLAEAFAGLLIGFSVRIMVFALQMGGTAAAQSFSLSQMFGGAMSPEPEPTIASLLTLSGVALALSLGLHVKATMLIIQSYDVLPLGQFALGADAASWTTSRMSAGFSLAMSIATPFLVIAFVYNLALGLINKAMPQMMVAFVGMPLITWAGMVLLMIISGTALSLWSDRLDLVLDAPLGLAPGR